MRRTAELPSYCSLQQEDIIRTLCVFLAKWKKVLTSFNSKYYIMNTMISWNIFGPFDTPFLHAFGFCDYSTLDVKHFFRIAHILFIFNLILYCKYNCVSRSTSDWRQPWPWPWAVLRAGNFGEFATTNLAIYVWSDNILLFPMYNNCKKPKNSTHLYSSSNFCFSAIIPNVIMNSRQARTLQAENSIRLHTKIIIKIRLSTRTLKKTTFSALKWIGLHMDLAQRCATFSNFFTVSTSWSQK